MRDKGNRMGGGEDRGSVLYCIVLYCLLKTTNRDPRVKLHVVVQLIKSKTFTRINNKKYSQGYNIQSKNNTPTGHRLGGDQHLHKITREKQE